jgi:eukaryotic-like serine/threonine-protein kinase
MFPCPRSIAACGSAVPGCAANWRRRDAMTSLARLRELFDAASTLPPDQRANFLERSCEGDPELRAEIEALLACDTVHDDPLAASIAAAAIVQFEGAPWLGRRVGNYRIVGELGRGGMGSVYLAERADREYESRVAIKLIRGFPTADALDRLRRERQVLAGLVHPNIARLLDGGTTEEGQPFLVIEHIAGLPLTAWMEQREPSLDQRLRLFLELCRAVHYAHQNLIVHRDLKPGNVMVREDGTPVLLDFGIAKLTSPDAIGERVTELRAFTEDYASPEQIRGGAVTTASDVYALGLILYELLCGKRYKTGRAESWRQARPGRIARDAETLWLRSDAARIEGDLEHVVRHALAEEPQDRYPSVASLAVDIERYFDGKPLEAGPDRIRYRFGKFVRRHRLGVAAGALALAAIVGAAMWLGIERNRAVRAERHAEVEAAASNQVTDFLLQIFKAADPEQTRGRDLSARELLDGGREKLGNALADQPLVRARLLSALGEIYVNIGQPGSSAEMLDQAIALLRAPGADPLRLAFALNEGCHAYTQTSNYERASTLCHEALSIRQAKLPADDPDIGHSFDTLGVVEQSQGDFAAAEHDFRQTLGIFSAAGPEHRQDLASAHHNIGYNASARHDYKTAREEYQIAYDMKKSVFGDVHPSTLNSLNALAQAEQGVGDLATARTHFEKVLQLRVQVHGEKSIAVAHTHNDLAAVLQDLGDYTAAEANYRAGYDLDSALLPDDAMDIATTANNLATLYEDRGDFASALPLFRRSLAIREKKFKPSHPSLARAQHNIARCLMEMGDPQSARPLLDAAIESRSALPAENPERFDSQMLNAEWLLVSGDARASDAIQALSPPSSRGNYFRRMRTAMLHARLAATRKQWKLARASAERALAELRAELPADHPQCAKIDARIASYDHANNDDASARTLLHAALPVLHKSLNPLAPDRVDADKLAVALGVKS